MTDNVVVKASLNINETHANTPHWVAGVDEITFQKQLRKDRPIVYYSSPEIHWPAPESVLNYPIASAPLPTLPLDKLQTSLVRAELEQAQRTALPESTSTLPDDSREVGENFEGAGGARRPRNLKVQQAPREPRELEGTVGGVSDPSSEIEFRGLYGNLGAGVELFDDVFVDPALPQVKPTPNILPLQVQYSVPIPTTQVTAEQSPPIQTTATQHTVAPVTTQVVNPHLLPTQGVTIPLTTQVINPQPPPSQAPVTQYATLPVTTQIAPVRPSPVQTTAQPAAQPPVTQPPLQPPPQPQPVQTVVSQVQSAQTVQQPVQTNLQTAPTQPATQPPIQVQVTASAFTPNRHFPNKFKSAVPGSVPGIPVCVTSCDYTSR